MESNLHQTALVQYGIPGNKKRVRSVAARCEASALH